MHIRNFVVVVASVLSGCSACSQPLRESPKNFRSTFVKSNSLAESRFPRQFARAVSAPALLIGAGVYSMSDNDVLNKLEVKEERDEFLPNFTNHTDNYLQYAPIAAVYGLNLAGVKGRNDFTNRTILFVKSEILVSVLTYSLKQITAVPRPDSGKPTSMPSGHTAQAFAAATFMAKEYGQKSIWYSIGAYAVATGVGTMRVLNNRHWVSDVLVGAGVGVLSTNIAYLTHQHRWGKRPDSSGNTLVVPSFDGRSYAVAVIHRFK